MEAKAKAEAKAAALAATKKVTKAKVEEEFLTRGALEHLPPRTVINKRINEFCGLETQYDLLSESDERFQAFMVLYDKWKAMNLYRRPYRRMKLKSEVLQLEVEGQLLQEAVLEERVGEFAAKSVKLGTCLRPHVDRLSTADTAVALETARAICSDAVTALSEARKRAC